MINDFIDVVFKRISELNSIYDLNSIPHSDVFFRDTEALFGLSGKELNIIINILNESHKIFIMEISREEYDNKTDKIYGYVDSDISNLKKLQSIFHRGLMNEYERVYYNRKIVAQIIKELMPIIKSLASSMLGVILNKAFMIDSYIYLVEKNFKEFTDEWKNEQLQKQIAENEPSFGKDSDNEKDKEKNDLQGDEQRSAKFARAVDSPFIKDFTDCVTKESVTRVLNIYGVDFFFRVHLRKYKFSYLSQVIETGIINRKSDLLKLKEMVKKVKENINRDKELENYYDDIMSLDIKISRSISYSKK